MKPTILFIFLLLTANAYAFDCSGLGEECYELEEINESLIANLIYTNQSYPDHSFIYDYNSKINIDQPPSGIDQHYKGIIERAWLDIFTIMPSVRFNNSLYVPEEIQVRADYDYKISIPDNYYSSYRRSGRTCKIIYSLSSKSAKLSIYRNNQKISSSKISSFEINKDSTIKAVLDIKAKLRERHYEWERFCCRYRDGRCRLYCYDCDYDYTDYTTYSLQLTDREDVKYYNHKPQADFVFISKYYDSYKGNLTKDNKTSIELAFNNSLYKEQEFIYSAEFSKKPYYFLNIKTTRQDSTEIKNIIKNDNLLYVKDASKCQLTSTDFFQTKTTECDYTLKGEKIQDFEKTELSSSWNLLFKIIIFIIICGIIYALIKRYWGKYIMPVGVMILSVPFVSAEECGLTNLASCIPEKMYEFFIELLNSPLQPLLDLTRKLLENPPSVDLFYGVWAIMVYCVSLFYGFLFMYSGFQFLFSGHNVIKREMAKEWLKNTIIMIVLIQASFYLYGLVIEIAGLLTSSILSMVDPHFFMLTADNIVNIGLEFLSIFSYVIVLFLTIILLLIRYLVVSFGIIFAPIGIFCYFIPPLKSYGKLILHMLGMFIFITFLDAIIILGCSMLIEIPMFENVKILVMVACFFIIDLIFIVLIIKVIFKSVFSSDAGDKVAQAVKYIAMMG